MSSDPAPPHPLQELVGRYDADSPTWAGGVNPCAGAPGRPQRRGVGRGDRPARGDARARERLDPRRMPDRRRADVGADRRRRPRRHGRVQGGEAHDPPQPARRGRLPGRHQQYDRARAARFATLDTDAGRISTAQAGEGPTVIAIHGLGASKASFLPDPGGDGRGLPHRRDGPAGLRRLRQAARRPLPRAVLRARRSWRCSTRWARDRAHLIGNSLGGRVALEVGLRPPRARGPLGAARAVAGLAGVRAGGRPR